MNFGRQNIIVGGIAIFVAAAGGMVLGFTMDAYFPRGFYEMPLTRALMKAGHTHGMPFALYNLIFGSLIDRLALDDWWKKRGSPLAMLAFSVVSMLALYAIQRLQLWLPFNPQRMGAVEAGSAFNTAASFTTNTNWQGYVGEATMSYLSQMSGLAWHNFISAAAGIAVAVALARGLTRHGDGKGPGTIGNVWVDITRATVYILLPLALVFALVFVSQGMIQNLNPYAEVTTVEGGQQVIHSAPGARGWVDSLIGSLASMALREGTAYLGRSAGRLLGTTSPPGTIHHDSNSTS